METKIVYRYEKYEPDYYEDNVGPYTFENWKFRKLLIEAHQSTGDSDSHPCVNRDTNYRFDSAYLCACESIEQLRDWFRLFNSKLKKAGFSIVKYEVKSILETNSKRQLAFCKYDIINREIVTFS